MTIMNDETREFVAMHRNEDVRELALKAKRVERLDLPSALDQIAGWQIARKKLPQWASCEGIVYPPHISMEQCSSQFTAQYKSEIAQTLLAPAATVRARVSDSGESDTQEMKMGAILPNRSCKRQKVRSSCPILQNRTHWWREVRWWI